MTRIVIEGRILGRPNRMNSKKVTADYCKPQLIYRKCYI